MGDAAEGVENAQTRLELEQEQQKRQETSHVQLLSEKAEFEQVHNEKWQPVKSGTILGKDWRTRNKMIDMITQTLLKAGIDQSLVSALPVALKTKPAERGPFAQKTLDFAEECFSNHITGLAERSAKIDITMAEHVQAVAVAHTALSTASKTMDEKTEEQKDAKDLSNVAKQARDEAVALVEATAAKLQEFATELENERKNLLRVQEVSAKFEALKERRTTPLVEASTCEEKIAKADEASLVEVTKSEAPIE